MSHQSCILFTKKGQRAPLDLVKAVISNNPTCAGAAAFCSDGILLNHNQTGLDVESLEELQKELESEDALYFLGNHPTGSLEEDTQPFTLLTGGDDEPLLVCFIEGKFSSDVPTDSSHSMAYHLYSDYLVPKIMQLITLYDSDVDKLFEYLKSNLFKKEMDVLAIGHGNITFLCSDGNILTFGANPTTIFPWGWTSQAYGFAPEVEKPVEKKTLSLKIKPKAEGGTPIESPKTDTKIPDPVPVDDDPEFEVTPPASCDSNGKKEQFYRMLMNGDKPSDYKKGPTVKVKLSQLKKLSALGKLKSFPDLAALLSAKPVASGLSPMQGNDKKTFQKSMEGKLPEGIHEVRKPVIIDATQKKAIETFIGSELVKGHIDRAKKVIEDPKNAQKGETKAPTFWEATGINMEETFGWPIEVWQDLQNVSREAILLYIMDLIHLNAKNLTKETEVAPTSVPSTGPSSKLSIKVKPKAA